MVERFAGAAREVLVRAEEEAHRLAHPWVGTEHLLLGVLARPDAPGVNALAELGITVDTARAALGQLLGTGGLGAGDAEALRTLGIDLDEVRGRVEAAFGPGALDRPPPHRARHRLPWRRRGCEPTDGAGHLPLRPRARRALERSGREAVRADGPVGVAHILLGLLDPRGNMAVELLRHLGADPAAVRARVLDGLGQAA